MSLCYQTLLVSECFSVLGEPRVAFTLPLALWLAGIFIGSWYGDRRRFTEPLLFGIMSYLVLMFPMLLFIFRFLGIQDVPLGR